jgi:Transglutaminase-like superfamily
MSCSRTQVLGGRLLRVLRMPPPEILTTLHVMVVLVVVESLVRWVSLPRLSRMLGVRVNLAPSRLDLQQIDLTDLPARARRQLRCTRRVADAWPFSRGPCLRRALVTGHLLRDLDPSVRLGVAGTGDTIHAHAWVEIDDRPLENVTGFNRFQRTPTDTTA